MGERGGRNEYQKVREEEEEEEDEREREISPR